MATKLKKRVEGKFGKSGTDKKYKDWKKKQEELQEELRERALDRYLFERGRPMLPGGGEEEYDNFPKTYSMKKGGKVKKSKKVKSHRGDGIAKRGRTRGRIV